MSFEGFHTTKSGIDYMVYSACSDDDFWLYFMLYYDGKDLRGFVPTRGNAVNTLTKSAFSYDYSQESEYCEKYGMRLFNSDEEAIDSRFDKYTNLEACIEEFEARLDLDTTVVSKPFKIKAVSKHVDDTPIEPVATQNNQGDVKVVIGNPVYWDCLKFKDKWLIPVSWAKSEWKIDLSGDFTFSILTMMAKAVGNSHTPSLSGKTQIRAGVGGGILISALPGQEVTYGMAKEFCDIIEKEFPSWCRIDMSEMVAKLEEKRKNAASGLGNASQGGGNSQAEDDEKHEDEYRKQWLEDHYGSSNVADFDVYYTLHWDYSEKRWEFLISDYEDGVSDDEEFGAAVTDYIEEKLPEFKFEEFMEGSFYIKYNGGKNDGKYLQWKPEIEYFKRKMSATFPDWGKIDLSGLA